MRQRLQHIVEVESSREYMQLCRQTKTPSAGNS